MPFDGITIHALCLELEELLAGSRIDKIHQPEKDELILSIRQPRNGSYKLLISANARWARMQLQETKSQNPLNPSSFCMLLRKYLEGGKVKNIRQLGMERIVHIDIEALNEFREWHTLTLICEFMGKHSNIILINPTSGIIIDAIKKYSSELSSYREVLPGRSYLQPPDQGKINMTQSSWDNFYTALWKQEGQTLSQALFQACAGFSPFAAQELCRRSLLDPSLPVEEAGKFELQKIYENSRAFILAIEARNIESTIAYSHRGPEEFAPYPIVAGLRYQKVLSFPSVAEACSRFFDERLSIMRLESLKTNLARQVKDHLQKAYRKEFLQSGDLAQAEKNLKYRIWGELLTAYAYQLKKGEQEITLPDFDDGQPVVITLEPHLTPMQNAQKFFKTYNKSTKTIKNLGKLIIQTQEIIDYLESVLVAVDQAENPVQIEEIIEELEKEKFIKGRSKGKTPPKKVHKSQPRCFVSSDGFEILVGRNNRQNDMLTLKMAQNQDLWLHVKDQAGTHVIIRNRFNSKDISQIPDHTLEEAAGLAAYYSKASQSEKVEVDYTWRQNVHKPSGARPGIVHYVNFWTININPQSPTIQALIENAQAVSEN